MYSVLLTIHSLMRWLVLAALVFALIFAYRAWFSHKKYTPYANAVRFWTTTIVQVQFVIGLWLYSLSPIVRYFFNHLEEGIHIRDVRFFGLEHIVMMLVAVTLITTGSVIAKRARTDSDKFRAMAIWFSIGFVVIFISIPWAFSPFTGRPYYRIL